MTDRILTREECPRKAQSLWEHDPQAVLVWAKEHFDTDNASFYNNYVTEVDGVYFRKFTLQIDGQFQNIHMDISGKFTVEVE
jgi:hypothetical protein